MSLFFFFFNDTATTEIYTLSLHDALPICIQRLEAQAHQQRRRDGHGRAETGSTFQEGAEAKAHQDELQPLVWRDRQDGRADHVELPCLDRNLVEEHGRHDDPDRKSTRLNSSHSQISYAVFCLKKKKK